MGTAAKIAKNSASNGTAFLVEAITAFAMMPYVIHYIGDEAYGVWILINAVSGYLGLFKLGFRPSINKHVSHYKALSEFAKMREFVAATILAFVCVAGGAFVVSAIVAYSLPNWTDLDSGLLEMAQVLILFAGAQMAIALMGTVYGGVISGYQRYDINAGIEISVIVVRAAIIFFLLPYFTSLYAVALTHFAITIIGYFVTIYFGRRVAPVKALKVFIKPPKDISDTIIKFNSISFAIGGLSILVKYADSIIVGALISTAAITHYAVGGRLIKYTSDLLSVTTRVIAPAISELDAKNDVKKIGVLVLNVTKFACFVSFAILLCLVLQGQEFIFLWMGGGYEESYNILFILALAYFFICPQQVVNPLLFGTSKHDLLLKLLLIETVISLPLAFYLGEQQGMVGVAIGLMWPRAVLRVLFLIFIVHKRLNLNPLIFFAKTYFRIAWVALPYGGMLYWSKVNGFCEGWISFALQLMVCLVVYLISLVVFGLNSEERVYIFSKFKMLKSKK